MQQNKILTLSYDDGVEQDLHLLEILNRYGVKCTFNVNTGLNAQRGTWVYQDKLEVHRLAPETFPEVYRGHELAVHGTAHLNPTELNEAELDMEYGNDFRRLTALTGRKPTGAAYAYGAYNDRVVAYLKGLGIHYARTVAENHAFLPQHDLMRFAPTCRHADPLLFELAAQFLEEQTEETRLFYLWGHSYEFEGNGNWSVIERFCEMMAAAGVRFMTNAEAFAYMKSKEQDEGELHGI